MEMYLQILPEVWVNGISPVLIVGVIFQVPSEFFGPRVFS